MKRILNQFHFFKITSLMTIVFYLACHYTAAMAKPLSTHTNQIQKKIATLEANSKGRLGVFAVDTANSKQIQYRTDERFPMGCTSKVMGVAALLKQAMTNHTLLNQKITYTEKEVETAGWAPVTSKHLNTGMTMLELCKAAIMQSDNLAMNLIMKKIGGPKAVNDFARSIGDSQFRLDRWYPEEASAIPGDLRDTSTPKAMVNSFKSLLIGKSLAPMQRKLLLSWLIKSTTGYSRIRAGIPKGWVVGDKTGSGDYGTTNDIAIIWPPGCSPIILGIYFTQDKKDAHRRNDVLASVTRDVIRQFAQTDQCIKLAN